MEMGAMYWALIRSFSSICLLVHDRLGTKQAAVFVSVFLDSKYLMNLVTSSQGKYMRRSIQGNRQK